MGKSLLQALALLVLVPLGAYVFLMAGSGIWLAIAYHQAPQWHPPELSRVTSIVAMGAGFSAVALLIVLGTRMMRIPHWLGFIIATLLIAVCVDRLIAAMLQQTQNAAPWSPMPDLKATALWTGVSAPFALSASLFHWLIYRQWGPRAES